MRAHALLTTIALAGALAGCGRPQLGTNAPSGPGPDLENPQVRESILAPRAGPGLEGVYTLTAVNGNPVPAVVETRGSCTVRVVSGRLALQDGRFTATATGQETCGGTARDPSVRRTEGTYSRSGSTVRLTGSPEGPFGSAGVVVQILDDETLLVTRVEAGTASREVSLRLRKERTP